MCACVGGREREKGVCVCAFVMKDNQARKQEGSGNDNAIAKIRVHLIIAPLVAWADETPP